MKIRSLGFGLLIVAGLFLPPLYSLENPGETNAPAVSVAATNEAAAAPAQVVTVTVPGLDQMLAQLEAAKRANEAASLRWAELMDQNHSLSNVLVSLEKTVASQKEREIQISAQARDFNFKVMAGAAAGVILVLLASYWFQWRCMNRVMEISRQMGALPAPVAPQPPMLEWQSAREGKLLEAVKLLESRVQHLEAPPAVAAPEMKTRTSTDNGHSHEPAVKLIDVGPAEPAGSASKASLLLAKGEILLDMERWEEAVTTFQEATALDPNNSEAHLKRGIALERTNNLEQALEAYENSVRLNPSRAFGYVYKARVLAALHRYDEALSVYDSALGKNAKKNGPVLARSNGN